jgi:hypothetical protein
MFQTQIIGDDLTQLADDIDSLYSSDVEYTSPLPRDEQIELDLPICGQKVWLRLPRGADEEFVTKESKRRGAKGIAQNEADAAFLLRISRYIHHTENIGENDWFGKEHFLQDLKARDLLLLRQTVENIPVGIDLNLVLDCPSCGNEIETTLPFNEEFFRPKLAG